MMLARKHNGKALKFTSMDGMEGYTSGFRRKDRLCLMLSLKELFS